MPTNAAKRRHGGSWRDLTLALDRRPAHCRPRRDGGSQPVGGTERVAQQSRIAAGAWEAAQAQGPVTWCRAPRSMKRSERSPRRRWIGRLWPSVEIGQGPLPRERSVRPRRLVASRNCCSHSAGPISRAWFVRWTVNWYGRDAVVTIASLRRAGSTCGPPTRELRKGGIHAYCAYLRTASRESRRCPRARMSPRSRRDRARKRQGLGGCHARSPSKHRSSDVLLSLG